MKEGWNDYYNANKDDNLTVALCNAVFDYFNDSTSNERGVYYKKSFLQENKKETSFSSEPPKSNLEQSNYHLNIRHHRPVNWNKLVPVELPAVKDLKTYYLTERPNLIGDLLHFYMSFIIRNTPKEHNYAYYRCLWLIAVKRFAIQIPIFLLPVGIKSLLNRKFWGTAKL